MALTAVKQLANNTIDVEPNNLGSTSNTLLHELQFGEQLNECVHQARRADFSLMLAMLCDDVREQSQFSLPQHKPSSRVLTEEALRQQFQLPKKSPLALESLAQINDYNQAEDIKELNLANIHLSNSINPKPLTFRDDKKHISSQVMTNTTLVCQAKHTIADDTILNKRDSMHVDAWLQNIQTSLVKSRLISGLAA